MFVAIVAFAAAGALSLGLTPIVRGVAVRRGLLDHAITARKIHGAPTPRLGGVAIVAAFAAVLGGLALAYGPVATLAREEHHTVIGILGGALLIAALGVYDDLVGADARVKFSVQFSVAALAYAAGLRIDILSLPLLGTFDLGALGLPLTLLWIVGVTNAMNLIDGLDGLAGGVALTASAALFMLALGHSDALLMIVTATVGGAVLGFLFFNFNPASIFMGDTGSMFLGYVLATAAIPVATLGPSATALLVPILALGLPICDTLLAMARRAVRGLPMFAADRGHIHHRLLALGFTQRQAALALYGSSMCLAGTALVVIRADDREALLALALVAAGAVASLRWLGFLQWRELPGLLAERRQRLLASRAAPGIGDPVDVGAALDVRALDARSASAQGADGPTRIAS
ncbi:MAG TPA: MraY family glycosyltransferase [Anaeromyxobacteraceae bacterium]|nr:MraY family glycosyltransferase [Anaeromyxobacteraceae bacterium]